MVARSSIEAKYYAMANTIVDLYWIRMLLNDIHVPLASPPVLWCDNAGATMLSHQIWSFMYTRNILKSTIILFERRWLTVTCPFASSPLVINVLIFLPKVSPRFGSNCYVTSFWLVPAASSFEWLLRKYLSCIIKSILFHL